jgi:hypothetical protein
MGRPSRLLSQHAPLPRANPLPRRPVAAMPWPSNTSPTRHPKIGATRSASSACSTTCGDYRQDGPWARRITPADSGGPLDAPWAGSTKRAPRRCASCSTTTPPPSTTSTEATRHGRSSGAHLSLLIRRSARRRARFRPRPPSGRVAAQPVALDFTRPMGKLGVVPYLMPSPRSSPGSAGRAARAGVPVERRRCCPPVQPDERGCTRPAGDLAHEGRPPVGRVTARPGGSGNPPSGSDGIDRRGLGWPGPGASRQPRFPGVRRRAGRLEAVVAGPRPAGRLASRRRGYSQRRRSLSVDSTPSPSSIRLRARRRHRRRGSSPAGACSWSSCQRRWASRSAGRAVGAAEDWAGGSCGGLPARRRPTGSASSNRAVPVTTRRNGECRPPRSPRPSWRAVPARGSSKPSGCSSKWPPGR